MIVAQSRFKGESLHIQFVAGINVNRNYGGAFDVPPEYVLMGSVEEADKLHSLAGSGYKYFRVFLLASDNYLMVFTNRDGLIAKAPMDILEDELKAYLKGA